MLIAGFLVGIFLGFLTILGLEDLLKSEGATVIGLVVFFLTFFLSFLASEIFNKLKKLEIISKDKPKKVEKG